MKKLAIPALLVATVMVAGAFAFMPVEQASTVHTTAASQSTGLIHETFSLDGLAAGGTVVLLDVTHPGQITTVHIAATLPSTNDVTPDANCEALEEPTANISLLIGIAGGTLADLANEALFVNTTIEGMAIDRNSDGDTTDSGEISCVYHMAITESTTIDGTDLTTNGITDIAIINGEAFTFPDDASVTITATVDNNSP